MVVIGLAATALVPVLITSARASQLAKVNGQAKNLSQERIDGLRNLPYHVDAQNGPFLDLLDQYYHDLNTTPTVLPNGGTGRYVASGSAGVGLPSGPYYEVSFANAFGVTGFSQDVYLQFLKPNSIPRQPVDMTLFPSYNSQVNGQDQPPSLMVGLTVRTSWSAYGAPHAYRAYTQISDNGKGQPLVTAQTRAVAVRVSSTAYDGSSLTGELASLGSDADLAASSSASVQARAANLAQNDPSGATVGAGTVSGAWATAVSPPNPYSSQASASGANGLQTTGSPCGWGSFGQTSTSDISSATTNAQPIVPYDLPTNSSAAASTSLNASGGTSCAGFNFSNVLPGSPATDPTLQLSPGNPIVRVSDTTGSGPLVTSSGSIATGAAGTPGAVVSTAGITMGQHLSIFPNLPASLVTDGKPLITIQITAQLKCTSGNATAVASYNGTLTYWTAAAGRQTVPLGWPAGGTAPSDPLTGIPLTTVVGNYNGATITLGTYIQSWSTGVQVVGGTTTGVQALNGIFSVTTAPTLGSTYPASAINLTVGQLSCVAADAR